MKRIASFSAALVLASAAGLTHAASQISADDFSSLTGPSAQQVSMTPAPVARPDARDRVQADAQVEQGLVGPQAPRPTSTITREQVIRERDQARAEGKLQPGYEYLNVVGAPTTPQPGHRFVGKSGSNAGQ